MSFIPWMFCGKAVSHERTASDLKVAHYHPKTVLTFLKCVPYGPTVKTNGARNTILSFYISWPVISHFSLLFLEKYNSLFLFLERFEDSYSSQSLFIRINSVPASSPGRANLYFLMKNVLHMMERWGRKWGGLWRFKINSSLFSIRLLFCHCK